MHCPTDIDAAAAWGANCGPAAIAAALGLELAGVRMAVSKRGRFPGHMGVEDVRRACAALERPIVTSSSCPGAIASWPRESTHLAMIEVDGPWRDDHYAAAARRHLVAARWRELTAPESAPGLWMIYDVNARQWVGDRPWAVWLMDRLAADQNVYPGSTGRWCFTWRGALSQV